MDLLILNTTKCDLFLPVSFTDNVKSSLSIYFLGLI